ncbi:MAG: hypothetical protein AAGJ70_02045 [Pseudomonadota bacterium]
MFDVVTLMYFVATTFVSTVSWFHSIELLIAALILLDLGARFLVANNRRAFWREPTTWIDVVIVASLIPSSTRSTSRSPRSRQPVSATSRWWATSGIFSPSHAPKV